MQFVLLGLYLVCLFVILFYCLSQLNLARWYLRKYQNEKSKPEPLENFPFVTVQLPVYNEKYVIERLIDSVAKFDYPKDRFEIQILDDSTDETLELSENKAAEYRAQGLQIEVVRRPERAGFKAGALQYGLQKAKGEFIAIFDADFLPHPDFLKKLLPYFISEKTGLVQARWEHINRNYSLLTKIQAFALDAHFSVEQGGRNAAGYFMNFNGTAGIWRRTCIEDAGGWQSDTLTEDLDLSYRAQMKEWNFKFAEEVDAPAELPTDMSAIKSQQFRWNKGAAEVARKSLGQILKSKFSFGIKLHAMLHLLNSSIYIFIFISSLLSIPLMIAIEAGAYSGYSRWISFFLVSLLPITIFYFVSFRRKEKSFVIRFFSFCVSFPVFLILTMGLSLHNTLAVLRGLIGQKTSFIRTPKFNIRMKTDSWFNKNYTQSKISLLTVAEGLLTLYFAFGIIFSSWHNDLGMLPYFVMLFLGFGSIFFFSMRHSFLSRS